MALSDQAIRALSGARGSVSAAGAALAPAGMLLSDEAPLAGFSDPAAWSRLSDADSLDAFGAAWLDLQCRLIGEVRSAVVMVRHDDDGEYLPLAAWPVGSAANPALVAVAELALQQRRGAARAGSSFDALAYPLLRGERLRGVVAIEVAHASDARLQDVMRLLQWGCAWWYRRLGLDTPSSRDLMTVLELLAVGLQEERFLPAATAVITELAAAFGCERVAFGTRVGRRAQVRAVSHTANFNKKSLLIRTLGRAMDEAIEQQATLVLPRSVPAVVRVTCRHQELLDQHGATAVCTVPLGALDSLSGALTLERHGARLFGEDEIRVCEHVGTLIGPVLEAKRREDRWIGAKVWDAGREFLSDLLGGGHFVMKATVLALLAVVLFFVLMPGDYRITAPAALEGTVQRAITAPQDGYIASAPVRAGDVVKARQEIVALEDKDLRLEKVQWEGEREQHLREYSKALAERKRAQVRILGAQVEQAEARVALLSEQIERMRLVAPFEGIVVSGDLSQSLGAPVARGDVLYEIAPLDSYRVVLKVDEHDISQLRIGQTGALALAGLPGEPLSVRVVKITPTSDIEQGKNTFRVEAMLERSVSALRPGMRGVAKIEVDQRKLFWIWTHKLVYWLRLWWWSWWP